jgi:hypothetical protein
MRADWLVSVDGRSGAEVEAIHGQALAIKEMLSELRKGGVNTLLLSEKTDAPPAALAAAREPLAPITTAEVALYHHLARFIEMPGLVNLRPYFSAQDMSYVLDSAGIITTAGRGEESGQFVPVGRLVDGEVELDAPLAAAAAPRSPDCDACPYALVCGVHCGRNPGFGGVPGDGVRCRDLFRRRTERVAPLVLFNKIQIV